MSSRIATASKTPGPELTALSEPKAPLPLANRPASQRAAVTLTSFGFKFGPPAANHVFDVSFLSNPARQEGWSLWSEPDASMAAWVMDQPQARAFLDAALPLVRVLSQTDDDVRIAFGCSAGRHRSAILVEELARRLRAEGLACAVEHRERTAR